MYKITIEFKDNRLDIVEETSEYNYAWRASTLAFERYDNILRVKVQEVKD